MPSLAQLLARGLGFSSPSRKPGTPRPNAPQGSGGTEGDETNKVYNPIRAKCGGVVTIDSLDFRGLQFTVTSIREWAAGPTPQEGRQLDGSNLVRFVDYDLVARPIDGEDVKVKLRLAPEKDSAYGYTHRAVVLKLHDDLAHDPGLEECCRNDTLKIEAHDDKQTADEGDDEHAEFWRIGDVRNSYLGVVKILQDENHDGKISRDEISYEATEFWDYSRMTDVEGVEVEELFFVEMNTHFDNRLPRQSGKVQTEGTGWFKIWRGCEVNPEKVQAY